MKYLATISLAASLAITPLVVCADIDNGETDILARRGKGVVTQEGFSARADKIPQRLRRGTLRDRNRVRDVVNTLLLRSQLAADAREAGFDKRVLVAERMQLAAETELAEVWIQHYVEMQGEADYEALAFQYYRMHADEILSEPKVDVTHILISTGERGNEEALALANSVYAQVIENPAKFDELVKEYSEDPSAVSNLGKFNGVKKGDMVRAFEKAAFRLQPGEISKPVSTEFGYHIIRLDAYMAPAQRSFDEVREQLVERETARHEERVKNDYLTSLSNLDVEMTEEALKEMVRRQFGEEVLAPEAESGKSE